MEALEMHDRSHPPISRCIRLGKGRPDGRRPAFTLIEVLVVVAIIALLIAILLPSLAVARANARNVTCAAHLKEMGLAATIFATEHEQRVPRGLSRHGGTAGRFNWVSMVARRFGDRNDYRRNFNRVRVENFEVFSCPQRSQEYPGTFLDYVINSMDHRGPITLTPCQPQPKTGTWYEVEGVAKNTVWKHPGETIYIMEAIEESWNISYPNNSNGTLRGIREKINEVRKSEPPTQTGFDWFDVPGAESLPTFREFATGQRLPRAALRMHLNLGSNAVMVDGHVEMIRPPRLAGTQQQLRLQEFYLKRFGVDRRVIPDITVLTATAAIHPCTAGDTEWQP